MIGRLIGLIAGQGIAGVVSVALGLALSGSLVANWLKDRELRAERAAHLATRIRADSLAIEWAVTRARADGWTATFGVASPDSLQARIEAASQRFATDLAESNVEAEQLAVVVSVLRDSIESAGQVTVAPAVDSAGVVSGVWEGEIAEDLLEGHWLFRLPAAALGLAYEARCPVDLVSTRGGDGRVVVFGRGSDPRCTPEIAELFVDPPAPVIVERGRSWWWRGLDMGIGAGALWLLQRATGSEPPDGSGSTGLLR